jgi:hypothetical protein
MKTGLRVTFRSSEYDLVVTTHVLDVMNTRDVSLELLIDIIQTGTSKQSERSPHKWWAFKTIEGRIDNNIAVTVAIENQGADLVAVNVMVSWKEKR